jgi:hypothetical protein
LRREGGTAPGSSAPASLPAPAPASPPRSVCRPGETQRCVGPGACEGGQACLADGSGFGICDCGDSKAGAIRNEVAPDGGSLDAGTR